MSGDLVTSMVNEMNLTQDRADFLHQQQGGGMMPPGGAGAPAPPSSPGMGAPMPGPGFDMSQEQQLQMMQNMQSGDNESSQRSSYSEEYIEPETTFERYVRLAKTPLIVGILFFIFSQKYMDDIIRQIVPLFISDNGTYYLVAKGLVVALAYFLSRYFIHEGEGSA